MKILGICGSSRSETKSSSYKLASIVLEATGYEYELISLRGKQILGCTACLRCVEDNICILQDDMTDLRQKIIQADAYVIAAPNFFSGINASTHALLERLYQFRHREANYLWGKLAVAVGVGGGDGTCVADQIESFMTYNLVDTIAKVSAKGAICCFDCGHGETCKVGGICMMHGPNAKITEDMIPDINKQPEVVQDAKDAGKGLARLLKTNVRKQTASKIQEQMMAAFKVTD